jgi:hypothetical protein
MAVAMMAALHAAGVAVGCVLLRSTTIGPRAVSHRSACGKLRNRRLNCSEVPLSSCFREASLRSSRRSNVTHGRVGDACVTGQVLLGPAEEGTSGPGCMGCAILRNTRQCLSRSALVPPNATRSHSRQAWRTIFESLHVWKTYIMRELDAYRGPVFESIAEQACTRLRGTARLPTIREWGRWEGLDRNRQQIEIDVVARLHRWKDVDGRRQVESQARRSFARKSAELAVLYSGVHERALELLDDDSLRSKQIEPVVAFLKYIVAYPSESSWNADRATEALNSYWALPATKRPHGIEIAH